MDARHLDSDTLRDLRLVMGNEFALLLRTFANDSAQRVAAIQQALAAQDADALRRSAHSFKGSSGNMGAKQLAHWCQQIEDLARAGSTIGSESLVAQLEIEFDAVNGEVSALLAELTPQ